MNKHPSLALSNTLAWGAMQIAGVYLLVGGLWILFSDQAAARIALNQQMFTIISLYKGWGYVLVTAFLLYLLIRRHTSALRANEEQLRRVIDAMPIFISYVGSDRRYRFTNQMYKERYDDPAEGKHVEEVMGKAAYRAVSKYVDRVLTGEVTSYETEVPYQDKELFLSATYIPDIGTDGQVKGFFVMAQDRTAQREAEEEYRLWADAFESCYHGIAIADPHTNRIAVCNPAFASLHKSRVEDIVGSAILSLYAPADHELVRHNIQRADQIGHARYEAHMTRKDGSIFPVQMDIVSVLGEDGEFLHRVLTAQDISERKLAEENLRKNEERYRYLFENNPHPMWTYDLQTLAFLDVNEAAVQKYGYSRSEFLRMTIADIRPPEDVERLKEHLSQPRPALQRSGDWRHRLKDGTVIDVEITSHIIEIEDREAALVVAQDVTERKQAEEALRQSEAQLSGIFNSAMDAIISTDADQRILIFNPAAEAMFKCKQSEVIGQTLDRFLPERFREIHRRHVDNFGQTGITKRAMKGSAVVFGQRSSGEEFPCEASISQIDIAGKKIYTVILRDFSERMKAEEVLRQSEERFASVFRSSPTPIALTRLADGKIMDVNEAFCQLFGYSHEEIVGRTSLDVGIANPESRQKAVEMLKEKGAIRNLEQKARNRDGTLLDILKSVENINVNGEQYALTTLIDITRRKQAEEYLRRFELLSEHSRDIILFMDREDGRILEANAAAVHTYGYSREELLSLTVRDLRARDTLGLTGAQMAQADAGGLLFETVHQRKDGTTFPVEVSSQGATIGGVRTLISIVRDITGRKQIEKALQAAHDELELKVQERTAALSEANALLQALMDNMPDHIYFKNLQSRFIRTSRSQANMLGLSNPAEVIGKSDFDFFPHAARSYGEEQEVMSSGKPLIDLEEWVVWPDGRETWVSTTKMPLRNAEGQTIGIFGISHDVTERKRTEQEIKQLNADLEKQAEKLQAANKELEAFSYSVSHDLRAPLRAIDGYTRILVEDYESSLDAEGKRVCAIISREARRMGQLIDDLLAFSRLGRKEMYASKIDMRGMAVSVLNELLKEDERARLDFQIGKLPTARGDSSLIRQVWFNLLANAIKFTSRKERALIEIGSKTNKNELIYYVRDTGAGFDMEYANKLFGVFQRLHSESEFDGTGVGLAIIQRIIHRHEGRVWAEGEVGKGAAFYFALPRKEVHHE
jgi:PAS domain S-box-containing protein